MKLVLDRYAYLKSPLHRWKQSYKLVGLFGLIFAFAFIQQPILLPAALIVTWIIFQLSNLPLSFLLSSLALSWLVYFSGNHFTAFPGWRYGAFSLGILSN